MTLSKVNMAAFGTEKSEAAIKGFGAVTKAVQATITELADYNRQSFDRAAAFVQELAGARNPAQAIQIEANYWLSASEALASEMSKLGQLWAHLAQETVESFAVPVAAE